MAPKAKTVEKTQTAEPQPGTSMATQAPGGQALAAMPSDLQQYAGKGTEGIGSDDVRPPRLALAQAMSPQVKRDNVKYIQGLQEGNLFNDLSGENYGDGPIDVVIVKFLGVRGIQFAPIDDGGGVLDFNVPLTDKRMQFTDGEDGKRVKPVATKFYEYLCWLPDLQEVMTLSMKGTQLKVAMTLNSLIKLPLKGELVHESLKGQIIMEPPSWARTYLLGMAFQKKEPYSWANFTVKTKGLTPTETRERCAQLFDAYAKKNIIIEREPGDDTGQEDLAADM